MTCTEACINLNKAGIENIVRNVYISTSALMSLCLSIKMYILYKTHGNCNVLIACIGNTYPFGMRDMLAQGHLGAKAV